MIDKFARGVLFALFLGLGLLWQALPLALAFMIAFFLLRWAGVL
jgi:hypothetical protein